MLKVWQPLSVATCNPFGVITSLKLMKPCYIQIVTLVCHTNTPVKISFLYLKRIHDSQKKTSQNILIEPELLTYLSEV